METINNGLNKADAKDVVAVLDALTNHPRFTMRTYSALVGAANGNEVAVESVLETFSHDKLRRSSDGATLYRLK